MAQAMDVKSKTITESSTPRGPNVNRKPITIGKYPRIGTDCSRSMNGVRTSDATLFVAASMPKDTPQRTDRTNVIVIRETVLRVYRGRFSISGKGRKFTISQVIAQRITRPAMKLNRYLRKSHSPT
jgi:hypothetical protein